MRHRVSFRRVRDGLASLVLGIGNHEHEAVNYTFVVELQRATVVNESGISTVRIDEKRELTRFSQRVADNEIWHYRHTVTPTLTGERLRLIYLFYRGDAPVNASTELRTTTFRVGERLGTGVILDVS